MDFSATSSDPESPEAPEFGSGELHYDSAKVGKGILASGPSRQSNRRPDTDTGPTNASQRPDNRSSSSQVRRPEIGGLEGSGWSAQVAGWMQEDIDLLESSWRSSTLHSYKSAWNRWRTWTQRNKIDSVNPKPKDLAQFLCYLFRYCKLAPSTIALHKSVVCSFANPEKSEALSSSGWCRG
nr:unnamed protein product [Callosobruchus analis]